MWSNSDNLYDDFPRHWVGTAVSLSGMINIDGKPYRYFDYCHSMYVPAVCMSIQWYRFMSKDDDLAMNNMQQVNVTVSIAMYVDL